MSSCIVFLAIYQMKGSCILPVKHHYRLTEKYARMRLTTVVLTHLHLGIGPTGNFHHHVEYLVALIGKQWNVMPWRDGSLIIF